MDTNDILRDRTISPETTASNKNVHRFAHEAMATVFEIYIADQDKQYAAQAAQEAFSLVDQLDSDLSRFCENSDITRINVAQKETPVKVGPDAFECLLSCLSLHDATEGAFDVTVGALMDLWLYPDKTLRKPSQSDLNKVFSCTGMDLLDMDEEVFTVTKIKTELQLDLGGYGKGYAVEEMIALLEEWDIENMLVHGGYSSVAARGRMPGHSGWTVSVTDPFTNKLLEKIELEDCAMCSSGLQKGSHIIDPRTAKPVVRKRATWILSTNAATADGLSTAFMVMDLNEIGPYVDDRPELSTLIINEEKGKSQVLRLGNWWD